MQVNLSKWQTKVWDDPHRFRVVCAGRRSGKSVLAQLTVIDWAVKNVGTYWIVAPTYRQAKQIHWKGLQHYVPQAIIDKKNEVELSITLKNGSIIELKGAENPDALRGVKLRGLVVDEIASIRNWEWLWQEVLRPTLTDYIAPALFISTPKGFNHFYNLYQEGQSTDGGDYRSWRFTSYDNPYVSKEEIDAQRKELTEDTFQQEFMADFKTHTGLVHKTFERTIHILPDMTLPKEWQRARGFDFGSTHYTASIRFVIPPSEDVWFVESCYLDNKRSIEDHATAILSQDYTYGFIPSWGDPSGGQWFSEFAKYNIYIEPARKDMAQNVKSWVEFCCEKVNERLKRQLGRALYLPNGEILQGPARLYVLDKPENQAFIKQIENLKWRENKAGGLISMLDEGDDPTGGHYDLMAALRYFAVSYEPPREDYRNINDFSAWKL